MSLESSVSPRDALRGWKSGGVPAEAGDAWRRWPRIGVWRWEPVAGVLHCCPSTVHRAEGFRRFAFREADPRSIPFRAVRIRRITGIR